jgi:exopolysaccharide biosynthesis polyprenyl glycosylphosphotransferase
MVKSIAKKLQTTCLRFFKLLLVIVLFLIFYFLFALTEPELLRASRTAAITIICFPVVCVAMLKIYGGFPIGIKKTKEIVYSASIATFLSDAITYLQLAIMRYNFPNRSYLKDFFTLIGILLVQVIFINLFGYLGNYLYFQVNSPADCIVIYGSKEGLPQFVSKIAKYKKQYKISALYDLQEEDLKKKIRHCDSVFLYSLDEASKAWILEYCYKHNKTTYLTPELSDIITRHSHHVIIDDVTVLESRISGLTFEQRLIKRAMDIVISGLGLLVASPFMLLEALAIKLEDRGPVFFRQPRVTKDGRVFNVLKFRTMIVDADKLSKRLASQDDDRITKVGKFLRKTRMDELPQFINILKGDMSIVGPRPEQEEITEKYVEVLPEFKYRLKVKAGLTGLAQIQGKYNTTPKDKLILDLIYIEQYSIWVDIKLILQTVKVLFKSDSTEGVIGELPEGFDYLRDEVAPEHKD